MTETRRERETMDYEGDGGTRKRMPRDAFEAALFERAIRAEVAGWKRLYDAEIGDYVASDGTWELSVAQKQEEFDLLSFYSMPSVLGRIWLEERDGPASEYYRIVVAWSLASGQANSDAPPVIDWSREAGAA